MTDREFKQLNRAQLIDVIYQLQLQVDELNGQKQKLEAAIADKRLRISAVGSIAEAALEINDCFRNAQNAADQYLSEIKAIREDAEERRAKLLGEARTEAEEILAKAKEEAEALLAKAREDAQTIVEDAKWSKGDYDLAIETILKEYNRSGNR